MMIANISPNNLSVEHTLNTLRYADRVKGEGARQSTLQLWQRQHRLHLGTN